MTPPTPPWFCWNTTQWLPTLSYLKLIEIEIFSDPQPKGPDGKSNYGSLPTCYYKEGARELTGTEAGEAWGRWTGGSGRSLAGITRVPGDPMGALAKPRPVRLSTKFLEIGPRAFRLQKIEGREAGSPENEEE